MRKTFPFSEKIALLLIFAAATFTACQKDPVLEALNNGQPVITPKTKASITVIQINGHPDLDSLGSTWDSIDSTNFDTLGRPDVFFNISAIGSISPVLWSQNSQIGRAHV